jgi:hypothetical protein
MGPSGQQLDADRDRGQRCSRAVHANVRGVRPARTARRSRGGAPAAIRLASITAVKPAPVSSLVGGLWSLLEWLVASGGELG